MFLRYPTRQRHIPIRRLIPNLLTTIALCCGLASLHFSLHGDWDRAVLAIGLSMLFDMLDGRAARMLRVSSDFGVILDSLSDFLAFGVAPAFLLHQWIFQDPKELAGLAAIMIYALCTALRLARFTAAAYTTKSRPAPTPKSSALASKFFVGMPSPAAAAAVLIPVMLDQSKYVTTRPPGWAVVIYTFAIAWLMVSRQPMFSFKRIRVARTYVLPLLVAVGLLVVLAFRDFWLAAAILAGAYLLSLPLSIWSYHRTAKAASPSEITSTPSTSIGHTVAPQTAPPSSES